VIYCLKTLMYHIMYDNQNHVSDGTISFREIELQLDTGIQVRGHAALLSRE